MLTLTCLHPAYPLVVYLQHVLAALRLVLAQAARAWWQIGLLPNPLMFISVCNAGKQVCFAENEGLLNMQIRCPMTKASQKWNAVNWDLLCRITRETRKQ